MDEHQKLMDMIEAEPVSQPSDLSTIRKKAIELRDLTLKKNDLVAELENTNKQINNIQQHELIDLFNDAKISSLTVDADGNHPAFVAERGTVYQAKIPDDKRLEAFRWLEEHGYGDLIKSNIIITFGMQEHDARLKVMQLLAANNIQYWTDESVHHMTLKAFVKRETIAGHVIPHDLLGTYIFEEVKIKQDK
jgi:hypothetical protein